MNKFYLELVRHKQQSKMNKVIALLLLIGFVSCKDKPKENTSTTENTETTQTVQSETKIAENTPESKLKGQFKFGLSQADKQKWKTTSRAYKVRSATANSIKMKLTFYGNGKGVYFHDDGKYEYMTQKMINDASFEYKVTNDSIMIKEQNEQDFKLFGIIKDESINKDYFDVDLINKADFDITFGMYKIGESPK